MRFKDDAYRGVFGWAFRLGTVLVERPNVEALYCVSTLMCQHFIGNILGDLAHRSTVKLQSGDGVPIVNATSATLSQHRKPKVTPGPRGPQKEGCETILRLCVLENESRFSSSGETRHAKRFQ